MRGDTPLPHTKTAGSVRGLGESSWEDPLGISYHLHALAGLGGNMKDWSPGMGIWVVSISSDLLDLDKLEGI